MGILDSLKSEVIDISRLMQAAYDACAATSASTGAGGSPTPVFRKDHNGWAPAAMAAALGIVGALVVRRNRSLNSLALTGFIAGSIGFGGALAWGSRDFTMEAGRAALKNMTAVRNSRWLARHPITYA